MHQVDYISPAICLEHHTGTGHPERVERLNSINTHLKECGLIKDLNVVQARAATREEVGSTHLEAHTDLVTRLIHSGVSYLDGDTTVSKHSLDAAYIAAGSALTGIERLHSGETKRVFCGVRPPGHHAEDDKAMGFCIFNNVAIAANHARKLGLAERVLILDWDVHHGNGTQQIFESSRDVFYYSLHQFPFYPGTGAAHETGVGEGAGFTLNRPFAGGEGDDDWLRVMDRDLQKIAHEFRPQLVIISAGFDAHEADPLGGMCISTSGFARMTGLVRALADSCCEGRILSVLEGGYNLKALAESVVGHIGDLRE